MSAGMEGRVVVITGAAGGIGAEAARLFDRRGGTVVATDVDEGALGRAGLPERALRLQLDVRDAHGWRRTVERVLAAFGRLDVLVNNAGIVEPGRAEEIATEAIERQLAVNLHGTILGCREVLRVMRPRRSGRIVNVASMGGIVPMPFEAVYCATKYGVRGYTFALRAELRGSGVTACVVSPDSVDTGQLRHELEYDAAALSFADAPLPAGRVARAILRAATSRRAELLVPPVRGALARAAMAAPGLVLALIPSLARAGARRQVSLRRGTTADRGRAP